MALPSWLNAPRIVLASLLLVGCGGGPTIDSHTTPVAPTIVSNPADATVAEGAKASFTVVAKGTEPLSYRWMANGVTVPGAQSDTWVTPATEYFSMNGLKVSVEVSNGISPSALSTTALLTVEPNDPDVPVILTQPADTTVMVGDTALFSVSVTGASPLNYQWMRNGTLIPGAMGSTCRTSTLTLADNGALYSVMIWNDKGQITSHTAKLTVSTQPTGVWSLTSGSLAYGRSQHTATLLTGGTFSGKVLVAGGLDFSSTNLTVAELYDPLSQTFMALSSHPMQSARVAHTATVLPSGKVLLAGGRAGSTGAAVSQGEVFDPSTTLFTATGAMVTPRSNHVAVLLTTGSNAGKVLLAGGCDTNGFATATAELFNPADGTFTATGSMNLLRSSAAAVVLADGRVLVVGGMGTMSPLAQAEVYDPGLGTWSVVATSLPNARTSLTATLLPNGKVLVCGGCASDQAEILTVGATSVTVATATMRQVRSFHTATLMPSGQVLVAGGQYGSASLLSAELFDPATQTFTATGSLHDARSQFTATVVGARVLVVGGSTGTTALSGAELFH